MDLNVVLEVSKDQLFSMAGLVENAFAISLRALFESDPQIGQRVIDNDKVINSYEIDIDNSTYNLLALSQVPAESIQMVVSIQKINVILERIGDHAVNIAESAISLSKGPSISEFFELPEMAEQCKNILHDALVSFFEYKLELAKDVLNRDDKIDALNISITEYIKKKVHSGAMTFESAMDIIRICKNLERIADLSSNIAEESNFSITGKIVKHHS